jgi:ribosomal protein S18 acetylase RimI-like enzyme
VATPRSQLREFVFRYIIKEITVQRNAKQRGRACVKNTDQYTFIQKKWLTEEDYEHINTLQDCCKSADSTALKLELDYKLAYSTEMIAAELISEATPTEELNEFFCYSDETLIGYIGICSFGGATLVINGMVHPNFRRQGIFCALFDLMSPSIKKRDSSKVLLLSDRLSIGGQAFLKSVNALYSFSEYEMTRPVALVDESTCFNTPQVAQISLRKANNGDVKEIARQNAIYFGCSEDEVPLLKPEDEEKRGMTIYIAEIADKIIGKIHLQISGDVGAVYGLGVLPENRGKGYGRAVLAKGIQALKQLPVRSLMLQVAAENETALTLYQSCGFKTESTMDYYLWYN